jgi:hypothetical protein
MSGRTLGAPLAVALQIFVGTYTFSWDVRRGETTNTHCCALVVRPNSGTSAIWEGHIGVNQGGGFATLRILFTGIGFPVQPPGVHSR